MPQYRLHTSALDTEGCEAVHRATLELLEGTGVEVQHEGMLALLASAGASVDGSRVRIPAGLVDDALAAAPRSITLASRGATPALELTSGPVYYGTGSDCIYVLGPGARDRRQGALADVEEMAALQEKLANIDFVLSMVHPHELPADVAPVAQFAAMLRGTSKPLIMVPEDARHLEVFNEMAAACGARGQLGASTPCRLRRSRTARSPSTVSPGAPGSASPWSTRARSCPARPLLPRWPAAWCSPTPRC